MAADTMTSVCVWHVLHCEDQDISDDFEKVSMKDVMMVDDQHVEQPQNTELNQPGSLLPDDDDDDIDDDVSAIDNPSPLLPSSSGELLGVNCMFYMFFVSYICFFSYFVIWGTMVASPPPFRPGKLAPAISGSQT